MTEFLSEDTETASPKAPTLPPTLILSVRNCSNEAMSMMASSTCECVRIQYKLKEKRSVYASHHSRKDHAETRAIFHHVCAMMEGFLRHKIKNHHRISTPQRYARDAIDTYRSGAIDDERLNFLRSLSCCWGHVCCAPIVFCSKCIMTTTTTTMVFSFFFFSLLPLFRLFLSPPFLSFQRHSVLSNLLVSKTVVCLLSSLSLCHE